jgi:two-component system, NarL family, sensor kinase
VRYVLELARRRLTLGDARAGDSIDKGIAALGEGIQEVRRISRDLRPGVLDDLGLGPALQALTDDFAQRTGIAVNFETVVFRNRLDPEARIALYRIAQEALTNIERHAGATRVDLSIRGYRSGIILRVADNGRGMEWPLPARADRGLGLRNMAERISQLDGTLRVLSSPGNTVIEAEVPLSHMLVPQAESGTGRRESA